MTVEEIRDLFLGEIDCSQVVAGEFSEETGIDSDTLRKMAGCFGGGMMNGDTCGCVTAAFMIIGLKYGVAQPNLHDEKQVMIGKFAEFKQKFAEKYPQFECRDILGVDVGQPGGFEKAIEDGKMFRECPVMCKDVIELLKSIL